jgi:hypothetical protein
MAFEERRDLGLDRLRQHSPGTLAQHGQKRIVRDARSWPRQGNNSILHGVSFQVISTITEDTPPPASSPKFDHSPRTGSETLISTPTSSIRRQWLGCAAAGFLGCSCVIGQP